MPTDPAQPVGVVIDPDAGRVDFSDGYYLPYDLNEIKWQLNIFRFCLVAAAGAIHWDYIVTIHEEAERWRQIFNRQPTLTGILILFARYAGIASSVSMLVWFFNDDPNQNCQALIDVVYGSMGFAYITLSVILVVRLRALWIGEGPRWMTPVMLCVLCWIATMRIVSIVGVHGRLAAEAVRFAHYPACISVVTQEGRQWIGWAGAAVFDLFVYVLTLLRMRAVSKGLARNASALFRIRNFICTSSTVYFVVSFSCNIGCTVSLLLQRDVLLQQLPIVFSSLANHVIACRIVFHSDLFAEGRTGLLVLDPHSREESRQRKHSRASRRTDEAQSEPPDEGKVESGRAPHGAAEPVERVPFSQVQRQSLGPSGQWPTLPRHTMSDGHGAEVVSGTEPVSSKRSWTAERSTHSHRANHVPAGILKSSRETLGQASDGTFASSLAHSRSTSLHRSGARAQSTREAKEGAGPH